ncbi:GNAT family N-acetyltransferase [Myxococcota bacterium]|nr:GNAT family N-acetyltransferase [Myxococcota bacterium]
MTKRLGFEFETLHAYSAVEYAEMTFPAYRATLLRRIRSENVVACGAKLEGTPVGLALVENLDGQDPTLRSIYVDPDHRRQNLATKLISSIEEISFSRGWKSIRAVFMEGIEQRTDLRRLIAKQNWSEPALRHHVIRISLEDIMKSPWMQRRRPLPPDFQVFPWKDLTSEEIDSLQNDHREKAWPDSQVFPFRYGPKFEPNTSFGVRFQGRVVGWVVNHVYNSNTLRFTCSFLREDLQKLGRLVELYARSVDRMKSSTNFERGILTVPVEYPAMVAFARRHLMPFADEIRETLGTQKTLSERT